MNKEIMQQEQLRLRCRNAGLLAFFFSGICSISSGIIVPLLQERYGFDYGMAGTLLSAMSIGNLLAGFLAGTLPQKLGQKTTALLLTAGYGVGYSTMGLSSLPMLFVLLFFLVGISKGSTLNLCTILVGNNVPDRTRGLNILHSCYALGALLCPFLVTSALRFGEAAPMLLLAVLGVALWTTFALAPLSDETSRKKDSSRWEFVKSKRFWLLTAVIFCQNAAETSVTGWLVTYFKDNGILSAAISPYTVTLLWGTTMGMRLLLAFVFPPKDACRAMVWMGLGTVVFYGGLMLAGSQWSALFLLFAFSLAIAGMNPTAVAAAGKMTSVTSMGIMLPIASLGAIVMPWIIGVVANSAGITIGMATNLLPCAGMFLFTLAVGKCKGEN